MDILLQIRSSSQPINRESFTCQDKDGGKGHYDRYANDWEER